MPHFRPRQSLTVHAILLPKHVVCERICLLLRIFDNLSVIAVIDAHDEQQNVNTLRNARPIDFAKPTCAGGGAELADAKDHEQRPPLWSSFGVVWSLPCVSSFDLLLLHFWAFDQVVDRDTAFPSPVPFVTVPSCQVWSHAKTFHMTEFTFKPFSASSSCSTEPEPSADKGIICWIHREKTKTKIKRPDWQQVNDPSALHVEKVTVASRVGAKPVCGKEAELEHVFQFTVSSFGGMSSGKPHRQSFYRVLVVVLCTRFIVIFFLFRVSTRCSSSVCGGGGEQLGTVGHSRQETLESNVKLRTSSVGTNGPSLWERYFGSCLDSLGLRRSTVPRIALRAVGEKGVTRPGRRTVGGKSFSAWRWTWRGMRDGYMASDLNIG